MRLNNLTVLVEESPNIVAENLMLLINLLRAIGIAFLAYLIYMVIKSVFLWKDHKRIKKIDEKIDLIYKKIVDDKGKGSENNKKKKDNIKKKK